MSHDFEETVERLGGCGPQILTRLLRRGGRIADVFAEESVQATRSLRVRRGRSIEDGGVVRRAGAGLRVFDEAGSGYASTEDLSLAALHASADGAAERFAAAGGGTRDISASSVVLRDLVTAAEIPPDTVDQASDAEISALLHRAADAALSVHPDADVTVALRGRARRIVVASSDGRFVRSAGSAVSLRVRLRNGDGTDVHAIGGGVGGVGAFFAHPPEDVAREAGERFEALRQGGRFNGAAEGEHPIVIAGGWGGVWLHEVVGHALEADVGVYGAGRIGDRVAGDNVTVTDDALQSDARGGAPVDDEGTRGRRTVLIEHGVLRGLLTDRRSALRWDLPESGNGRRQDFRHEPLPRMTNLTLAPGTATPEDLIAEADGGIFVKMIGSGRVNPSEDRFSFDVLEAYEIENGRLGRAVSGLRLEGTSSTMLRHVVGVAGDVQLDRGRGSCEKGGQIVPVSVGMPSILIDRMTVTTYGPDDGNEP